MRCPQCNERNSVAAKACHSCGQKFATKPIPNSLKIGAGVAAGVLILGGVLAAVIPNFTDPNKSLARVAKRVAAGPSDPNDAKKATAELDEAIKNFLKQNGTLPTAELSKKLQESLSESAFEVHVFDLPRGLSVVEVDTMLQATDYLLLKNNSSVKVLPLTGMEVFDTAKIINDTAPVIVILGHTAGQGVHKPLIRAYNLMPDNIVDETAKIIPELKPDGAATFAKNNKDILVDYSFYSLGAGEKLFDAAAALPQGLSDDSVHGVMRWTNGRYEPQRNSAKSQLAALYAMAKCLTYADQSAHFQDNLGQGGTAFLNGRKPLAAPPEFKIVRLSGSAEPAAAPPIRSSRHSRGAAVPSATASFLLAGKTNSFTVDLSNGGRTGGWVVTATKETPQDEATKLAAGQPAAPAPTADATKDQQASATDISKLADTTTATTTTTAPMPSANDVAKTAAEISKLAAKEMSKEAAKDQAKLSMTQMPPGTESSANSDNPKPADSKTKEETKEEPVSEEKQTGVTATVHNAIDASQVRVRSGPGPNYKPVTTISKGAKLTIIGKNNGWYKIKANGQTGFIYGGLVDYKTPDAYETITVHKNEGLTDEHDKSVGSSKPGDRLVVLSDKNGKLKVQLSNGQTAYIKKNAVDVSQDTPQFVP